MAEPPRICRECRHFVVFHHPRRGWAEHVCAYIRKPDRDGACLFAWPKVVEQEVKPDAC